MFLDFIIQIKFENNHRSSNENRFEPDIGEEKRDDPLARFCVQWNLTMQSLNVNHHCSLYLFSFSKINKSFLSF